MESAKDFVRTALIHEDVELATLNRLIPSKMACEGMIVPTSAPPSIGRRTDMESAKRIRCNHCMSEFYEDYIDIDAISADSGETCPVCGKGDALMDVDSPEKPDAAIRKECADRAIACLKNNYQDWPNIVTGIHQLRAAIEGEGK